MSDLREYFGFVYREFDTLQVEWRLYVSLFGKNKETVDLLNEVSGPTTLGSGLIANK
ncbi:hypothetical protein [Poseidonocella sedimentorum]|uniref:Uncharacterized protein n=1 Tax=Poseidonocella sedimentorum TaxID=871652 RepID=A0A1I6EC31_9RHOB|nr:hypothetical protein [Poseidonocella sedimentorum]SFR15284.1 hypothetical protein SAMN04515673_109116 [Poseidonocella sedimentorum]